MYDFVDESFDRNYSHENKLSIQVSLNGFSFCIQGVEDNRVLVFKSPDFIISNSHLLARRFREWYHEEELLQLPYKAHEIIVNNPDFSLIPEQLESVHLKKNVSELLPNGKETEYAEGWIKSIHAKLVYHLPPEFAKTIEETLGESRLLHPVQKLIGIQKRTEHENSVLLFFDQKDMYFILKKESELVLANIYRINHTNDAVYFILSVLQQFGVPGKKVSVLTGGKSNFLNELPSAFSRYFYSVEKMKPLVSNETSLPKEVLTENVCLF